MKPGLKLVYMLILSTSLWCVISAGAGDNPFTPPKLPFKKATIHYEVSGTSNGTETLYIRKHGQETARRSTMVQKIMFMTQKVDTLEITTPQWHYTIDLAARQGNKATNPQKHMQEEFEKLSSKEKKIVEKNMEEMGYAGMNMLEGKMEHKAATILGYECDKMEIMGSTVYSIHKSGIALKTITNMMGMNFTSAAVKINKGQADADVFTPPSDISMEYDKQADEMARSQAQHMMSMLKDPNGKEKFRQSFMQQQVDQQKTDGQEMNEQQQTTPDEAEIKDSLNKAMEALQQMMGQ